jgi:NAD-dependent DNA ligase
VADQTTRWRWRRRVERHVRLLIKWDAAYYTTDTAKVPDVKYDTWKERLRKLSPQEPYLFKVGAPAVISSLLRRRVLLSAGRAFS